MDSSTKQQLFDYYNERAEEYEGFYWGEFPAKIPNPELYKNDTLAIQELLPGYISGKCIDIACGTGFWLPVYEKNCTEITLIDQSESVLTECTKKINRLSIENKTRIIRDEIFGYPFKTYEFNSAFIGFLTSHLPDNEMDTLFNMLKQSLIPNGKFVIIDSVWNDELEKMGRSKASMIKRSLKDGREFEIYKRYFEKSDLEDMAEKYHISLDIAYWGRVFFLAVGSFHVT